MIKQAMNENTRKIEKLDPLVIDGFLFRMFALNDRELVVDGDDIDYFVSHPSLTPQLVLKVKKAVQERIDAWSKHTQNTRTV